ncbi:MAG TPA: FGGY family carbohydrate kinase, partial [Acidimicrobiia bacterium]|nr:FGGY family carbohydrate kinase [Acidimicrobiia bacterium]
MRAARGAVLTLDLGTSATKAALWRGVELLALARAPITTSHPHPGWAEQEPDDWWASVVQACADVRAVEPAGVADVVAVGFSAARETFALFDAGLSGTTPGA